MRILIDGYMAMTGILITNMLWLLFYAGHLYIHHGKDRKGLGISPRDRISSLSGRMDAIEDEVHTIVESMSEHIGDG